MFGKDDDDDEDVDSSIRPYSPPSSSSSLSSSTLSKKKKKTISKTETYEAVISSFMERVLNSLPLESPHQS